MARTTPRTDYVHACGFCNRGYTLAESGEVCGHCGTHQGCRKIVCPHCGYEEAEPPAWIINMSGFLSDLWSRRPKAPAEPSTP